MVLGLFGGDEIVVQKTDALQRQAADLSQEWPQPADVELGDRAVDGDVGGAGLGRQGFDAGDCAGIGAGMAADLVVHGLWTIERNRQVPALAVGEIVQMAHQQQTVGGHRRLQPTLPRNGERLADGPPGQGLGECET